MRKFIGNQSIGADEELIMQFYANCPSGYEVDHIIPVKKGGKHHQDNLQYLTPSEKKEKEIRFYEGSTSDRLSPWWEN